MAIAECMEKVRRAEEVVAAVTAGAMALQLASWGANNTESTPDWVVFHADQVGRLVEVVRQLVAVVHEVRHG